jgi:hexosaminidase
VGASSAAGAQDVAPAPAVLPRPVSVTSAEGRFTLTAGTVIWTDAATAPLGRQLAGYLAPATGWALPVRTGGTPAGPSRIVLRRDASLARLGPEGYRLEVRPGRVTVRAPEAAGVFYALQTLRQLLPPELFREAPVAGVRWTMPALTIEDQPRFRWRGAHLDVSRHFMPKEFVKKYIDLLALHKLNSFHWHLTEDQGWRLEIRKYPRLTEVGAWRRETLVGRHETDPAKRVFDRTPHGGFYTQDDAREIVAYAAARHVTVVPEIEMPGHVQAAIAAYPWLGVTGDSLDVMGVWGVSENILDPSERGVAFMQDVLAEVLEIFPGAFIHVGGDEAVKTQWERSPRVQARIRELGLKDEHELQSWFIRRMDAFLTARGRRLVGWDEILEGGLAPNATVMSWRGTAGGLAAARAGHDVVMAPNSHTYFDYYQSRDQDAEPLAIGGFTPLDSVYAYEPVPSGLEPQFVHHVLGAQAQLWTEYIPTPKHAEYMAYPRLTALAEVLWTPVARKDFTDFRRRLDTHLRRLDALDVNYRPLDGPRGRR